MAVSLGLRPAGPRSAGLCRRIEGRAELRRPLGRRPTLLAGSTDQRQAVVAGVRRSRDRGATAAPAVSADSAASTAADPNSNPERPTACRGAAPVKSDAPPAASGEADNSGAEAENQERYRTVIRGQSSSVFGVVETLGQWLGYGVYKGLDTKKLAVDPGLNQMLLSEGSSISQLFTQDQWERHRAIKRYWRHLSTTLKSTIFVRVMEPVVIISLCAAVLCAWNTWAPWGLPALTLPPLTHTLTGSVLSLSLVFRTNNANARVQEARSLLAQMVKSLRDLVRMSQYVPQATGQCREELLRYCRAFPWALNAHVRQGRTRSDPSDPTAFRVNPAPQLTEVLGPNLTAELMGHRDGNVPNHLLMNMSGVLHKSLTIGMSTQIHQQSELLLKELSHILAASEKILTTPIPISYTRHTSRTLIIWLLTLPMVLWPVLGWSMIPAVAVIAYLMIGADEIGVQLEEPFCLLPVRPLCAQIDEQVEVMMPQALAANDFKPAPKK